MARCTMPRASTWARRARTVGAKAILRQAEDALESGDPDGAVELIARYRQLRATGAEEPSTSTSLGVDFQGKPLAPLVMGGDESADTVERGIAAALRQRAVDEANEREAANYVRAPAAPAKRARKKRAKNPSIAGINRKHLKQATGLYRKFREADPKRVRAITVKLPGAVMTMGRISAIEYETTHNGVSQGYRHDFTPGSRPLLTASPKRNGLFVYGGRYHVTDRGIVDLDPKGREVEDKGGEIL